MLTPATKFLDEKEEKENGCVFDASSLITNHSLTVIDVNVTTTSVS
jgi:hypothetical protein